MADMVTLVAELSVVQMKAALRPCERKTGKVVLETRRARQSS